MADYKGFLRFSDEAVASVNWNDQQHSGEAGVTDETTGNVYPFGGGGGGDDLIELEYTFDNDIGKIELSKTPAELKQLIEAGKNFKFVCSAELAEVTPMAEGDTYIAVGYYLNDNILTDFSLFRAPFPTYDPDDASSEWRSILFTNVSGTMTVSFD